MADELVRDEVDVRGVATITLDSPANRNALSSRLVAQLENALGRALSDDSVRLVVLTGAGPVFCSGADLKEQRERNKAGERAAPGASETSGGLPDILSMIWNAPKPVIGRVNGPARAGGVGLVAACDIAVAVGTATFAFSEVRLGVIPAVISVVCVRKLGEARALELFLTAEPFDATRAAQWGLVTAVAPPETLDEAVGSYITSILKGGPLALAGAKDLVRRVPAMPMEEAFRWAGDTSAAYFGSAEALEGMTAFAEKRDPRWVR